MQDAYIVSLKYLITEHKSQAAFSTRRETSKYNSGNKNEFLTQNDLLKVNNGTMGHTVN